MPKNIPREIFKLIVQFSNELTNYIDLSCHCYFDEKRRAHTSKSLECVKPCENAGRAMDEKTQFTLLRSEFFQNIEDTYKNIQESKLTPYQTRKLPDIHRGRGWAILEKRKLTNLTFNKHCTFLKVFEHLSYVEKKLVDPWTIGTSFDFHWLVKILFFCLHCLVIFIASLALHTILPENPNNSAILVVLKFALDFLFPYCLFTIHLAYIIVRTLNTSTLQQTLETNFKEELHNRIQMSGIKNLNMLLSSTYTQPDKTDVKLLLSNFQQMVDENMQIFETIRVKLELVEPHYDVTNVVQALHFFYDELCKSKYKINDDHKSSLKKLVDVWLHLARSNQFATGDPVDDSAATYCLKIRELMKLMPLTEENVRTCKQLFSVKNQARISNLVNKWMQNKTSSTNRDLLIQALYSLVKWVQNTQ